MLILFNQSVVYSVSGDSEVKLNLTIKFGKNETFPEALDDPSSELYKTYEKEMTDKVCVIFVRNLLQRADMLTVKRRLF